MKSNKSHNKLLNLGIAFFACILISTPVFAHTGLKQSTPADDAVVTVVPEKIDLVFTAAVKLIKFELMGVGHEMPTKFEVAGESKTVYSIETPGMHSGKFTVNWAVIGADGHTVSNSYSFEVKAGA